MEWVTLDRIADHAHETVELRGWVDNRRSSDGGHRWFHADPKREGPPREKGRLAAVMERVLI